MKKLLSCLFFVFVSVNAANEENQSKDVDVTETMNTNVDATNINDEEVKTVAKNLIQFIVDNYLDKLQSSDIEFDTKKKIFKSCFEKYFAIRKISGFVLGKYVRELNEQDKENFMKYFTEQVTDMYTKQFDNFRNISVDVQTVEVKTINNKNMYIVHTLINTDSSTQDVNNIVKLDWTCIIENKDNIADVKISDMSISGISLRTTLRDVIQTEINGDFMGNVKNYIDNKSQQDQN